MAAHLEEQQELDNFKYFWKKNRPLDLCLADRGGFGVFGLHHLPRPKKLQKIRKQQPYWRKWWKRRSKKTDPKAINADLAELQKNYPDSISTAQPR